MLVELSVMEQRYQAVLAVVQDGWKVSEVAERLGVSRQSVHTWIARYEQGGLAALADRSHRPVNCPTRSHPRPRRRSASCAGSIRAGVLAGSSTSSPGWESTPSHPARPSTAA
jgi:transposase-like protein